MWLLTSEFDTATWPFLKVDIRHKVYHAPWPEKIVIRHKVYLTFNMGHKSILDVTCDMIVIDIQHDNLLILTGDIGEPLSRAPNRPKGGASVSQRCGFVWSKYYA